MDKVVCLTIWADDVTPLLTIYIGQPAETDEEIISAAVEELVDQYSGLIEKITVKECSMIFMPFFGESSNKVVWRKED